MPTVPRRLGGIASCLLLFRLFGNAFAEAPLRYNFTVGDRLVYDRRAQVTDLQTGQPLRAERDQFQLWCLARQGDEWFLLLDRVRLVPSAEAGVARGLLLNVDERGRKRIAEPLLDHLTPVETLLDLLPELRSSLAGADEWRTAPDPFEQSWRCTLLGPDPEHDGCIRVRFTLEDQSGVAAALGLTRQGHYWFDAQQQRLARLELQTDDVWHRRRTAVTIALSRQARNEPRWCDRRTLESQKYLNAWRFEDRLLREALDDPTLLVRNWTRVRETWIACLRDLDRQAGTPFAALAAGRLADLDRSEPLWRARASYAARWLGRTPPTWTLQDAGGQTLRSESVRQGFTVECLWDTSSLESLRAPLILRRLAGDIGERPCRVLTLNLDADLAQARRAASACASDLTTVLGAPIRVVESPDELPVFRVLGPDGAVRRVGFGCPHSWLDLVAPFLPDDDPATGG